MSPQDTGKQVDEDLGASYPLVMNLRVDSLWNLPDDHHWLRGSAAPPLEQLGSERNTIPRIINKCMPIGYKYNVYAIVMFEHTLYWRRSKAAETSRPNSVLLAHTHCSNIAMCGRSQGRSTLCADPCTLCTEHIHQLKHCGVHRGRRSVTVQYKI